MSPRSFHRWWRPGGILLLSLIWLAADGLGLLRPLEQWALGLQFRLRGPIESEARIVYVNRDVAASQEFGRAWFPREYYAMAGEALFELGEARGLFLDFVLTSNHLPQRDARTLTYPGNLAMQRFLLRYPGRVVLAAAYDGKKYPFSEYSSLLPDRGEGVWKVENGVPQGYDPASNPLPELPEFPLWCPPIDDDQFPFPGLGEVGLINTSPRLNVGEQVYWVPAQVEVENVYPSLFLINGMRSWQETIALEMGRDRSFSAVEDKAGHYLVVDDEGTVLSGVPSQLSLRFLAASLQLYAMDFPGSRWESGSDELRLLDASGERIRSIPLRDGQHVAVNWYSPWHVGEPELIAEVDAWVAKETSTGPSWSVPQIAKAPEAWIEAVEARDERAMAPLRLWGRPNDPYNPMVSISDVLILYDTYLLAQEVGAIRTLAFIRELFAQFKDAFVLIGPTDPMLQDLGPTPFDEDPVPKVSVHGNLLKTLVDGRFLHFAPPWVERLLLGSLTLVVGWLIGVGGKRSWLWKVVALGVLGTFLLVSQFVFGQWQLVLPLVSPLGSALSAAFFGIGLRLWEEEKQKARIRSLFGTYVSRDVVDLMVDSSEEPQLGGHECEVTAFFSDIEGFTSIGEQLPPAALVELMNEYLDTMTATLHGHQGTLDKYIGDAVVGIFGAPFNVPDHASRACEAALHMQAEQKRLRAHWRRVEPPWPERVQNMRTRIGLHSGEAIVGNMGSRQRFTYTMMGDSVNLASRLEQLAKTYGVSILVSEVTRAEALRQQPDFVFRFLDRVAVKGRTQGVKIFELLGRSEAIDGRDLKCITYYEAGLDAYLAGNFSEAISLFEQSARLELRMEERINPSAVMMARCRSYIEEPPDDGWGGVYVMPPQ